MKIFYLLFLILSLPAWSFRIEPMSGELELGTNKSYFNFVLTNPSDKPVPVQITLQKREMKSNGEEVLTETKDIEAFPDQLIIPPAQKRSVKVSYSGSSQVTDEISYRFIAEQLPLDLDKKKNDSSGIKMLLRYVAAFYVTPKDAKSGVACHIESKVMTCKNSGSKHQILNLKEILLKSGSTKIKLSKEDLSNVLGENILSGAERVFSMKSSKVDAKKYFVELVFEN